MAYVNFFVGSADLDTKVHEMEAKKSIMDMYTSRHPTEPQKYKTVRILSRNAIPLFITDRKSFEKAIGKAWMSGDETDSDIRWYLDIWLGRFVKANEQFLPQLDDVWTAFG